MRVILVSLSMAMLLHAGTDSVPAPQSSLQNFIKAVSDIFDAGPALWAKIGHYQAERAAQSVATQLTTIEEKKVELKTDLQAGRVSANEFSERVRDLESQLIQLRGTITRFATEIDSTSPHVANEMRAVAGEEMYGKAILLDQA